MITELKNVLLDDFWIMPQTPKYTGSGIPYVTSKNIKGGKINFENVNYISIDDYKKISKNRPILKNDILISMIGTLGETAIVDDSYGEFYGQNMFLVRLDNSKIDYRYFINFFKSTHVKNHLARKQNKSTQSYLKANHIESLMIPVFTIKEQKEIANQLDKVQDLIKLKTQQIEKLDELIKSQFDEMFGDILINDRGWDIYTISDISTLIKSGLSRKLSDEDIGIPVIRSGNIQNGQFIYSDIKYWFERDTQGANIEDYVLDSGDLLINFINSDSQIGKTAIFSDVGRKCIYTTNILRMKLKDTCNNVYYNYFALTDCYYSQLKKIIQPAVNQASFTVSNFSKMKIPIPPIELQNKFADFVQQIDKQKFEIEKSLKEMQELYESLMDKYFG